MKKHLWLAFVFLLSAPLCHAQGIPSADISVGVSDLYIVKGLTVNMTGPNVAFAVNANNWLGLVGDFGAYFGHIPQSFNGELYTFGPRFSLRKSGSRFVPFGQALLGGSHFSMSPPGISGGGTQLAFGLGGGSDIVLTRSGKFAMRGQLEYFGIRAYGGTTPTVRFSGGIVYRLSRKHTAGS